MKVDLGLGFGARDSGRARFERHSYGRPKDCRPTENAMVMCAQLAFRAQRPAQPRA